MLGFAALVASFALLVAALGGFLVVWIFYKEISTAKPQVRLPNPLAKKPPSALDIPEEIQAWIEGESEPWVREDMKNKALRLYQELGNWKKVGYELRKTLLESPSPTDSFERF